MVAARSASRNDLPEHGWVQEHLVYTHGDGVVAVPADRPDADGRPDVDSLADELSVAEHPELYFGEGLADWYAIVGTDRTEQGGTTFSADTGIEMSSPIERAVLALATGDVEPLLSSELTTDSQLLYRRDVNERLAALAPWATFGSDPYPVITADRVVWVVDGYTTSATYPYSQFTDFTGATVNYAHASLKATVDAYDGTVHLYRTELGGGDDPILDAWERIFPGLVEPIAAMPAALRDHLLLSPGPARRPGAAARPLPRRRRRDAVQRHATLVTVGCRPNRRGHRVSGHRRHRWRCSSRRATSGSTDTSCRRCRSAPARARQRARLATSSPPSPSPTTTAPSGSTSSPSIPEPGREVATPLVAQSAIDADPQIAQQLTLLNANGSVVQLRPDDTAACSTAASSGFAR